MIAKGGLNGHGRRLAAYLITSKDDERAELLELRGFAADNIRDAFTDVQIQAEATHSTRPFFHAAVRLPKGEELKDEQWRHVADRIEERLGFKGQPRAVAYHHGKDGSHIHIAWSRIDTEAMKALDPGLYKNKLKEVCRELEQELGLKKVRNERAPDDKTRAPHRSEFEQARRLRTNLKEIRNGIRECWDRADSGKAFAAALDEKGMILARGDRREFVIVDRAGGEHALSRRITEATAAETRDRMADIDRKSLPSVDWAKELQAERARMRDDRQEGKEAPGSQRERTAERPSPSPENAIVERATTEPAIIQPSGKDLVPVPPAAPEPELKVGGQQNLGPTYDARPALTGGDSIVNVGLDLFTVTLHESISIGQGLYREAKFVFDELRGNKPTVRNFAAKELERRGPDVAARKFTPAELALNPAARRENYAQQTAEKSARRERGEAIDRMGKDVAAGRNLNATDVQKLNRDDLTNLAAKGDEHLRAMIRERERAEARRREDHGRERERER